jgi:hypothetical protein
VWYGRSTRTECELRKTKAGASAYSMIGMGERMRIGENGAGQALHDDECVRRRLRCGEQPGRRRRTNYITLTLNVEARFQRILCLKEAQAVRQVMLDSSRVDNIMLSSDETRRSEGDRGTNGGPNQLMVSYDLAAVLPYLTECLLTFISH